jgi:predicted RNA-binding protein with PUA-like domain
MKYWLLKSESDSFSIDDLKNIKKENWTGVRNFQARNYMRDLMSVGDLCLFYHSSCDVPGVVGVCKVSKTKVIDETQFDKKSEYYDPKSKKDIPTWVCVEVKFVKKLKEIFPLTKIKADPKLKNMLVIKRGMRLSVQPVAKADFEYILQ